MITNESIFAELAAVGRLRGFERGREIHIDCPSCHKEAKKGSTHFSFGKTGGFCFVCGTGMSIRKIYEYLIGNPPEAVKDLPIKQVKAKTVPRWVYKGNEIATEFARHPKLMELWQNYKPLSEQAIDKAGLGVGVLPASKCRHERLVVPIYDGGKVIGFRGRRLNCDCDDHWTVAKGTKMCLYNQGSIADDKDIIICENPIDALLITDLSDSHVAVATLSVYYWKSEWIKYFSGHKVTVMYDNELVGNGGAIHRTAEMRKYLDAAKARGMKYPKAPKVRGELVARELRKNEIDAVVFDWGNRPYKSDPFDLIKEKYNV